MNKEELQFFLNKKVFIRTKDKFMYRGELLKVTESSIILDDVQDGETLLNQDVLLSVSKCNENKLKRFT